MVALFRERAGLGGAGSGGAAVRFFWRGGRPGLRGGGGGAGAGGAGDAAASAASPAIQFFKSEMRQAITRPGNLMGGPVGSRDPPRGC